MTKTARKKPAVRREEILTVALPLAEADGYKTVTRDEIARCLGVSGATVQYHFGTMAQLRKEIMRHAIAKRCLRVIAQGLVCGDAQAGEVPAEVRQEALAVLSR